MNKTWNFKGLLLCHLIIALLISTFAWPVTKVYWDKLDVIFFKAINGSLRWHPTWQIFWALANHKLSDWLEDIVILSFSLYYIRGAVKTMRPKRAAEVIFCIAYIALIIYYVNRLLFRKFLDIPRESPTLVVDSSVRLSENISWLHIKDDSIRSFPGDHATTAILFASSFTCVMGWRVGIWACLYGAFLCMPRLITGAHWLSDVIVGSGSIALFFLSWAFCSPLYGKVVDKCEKFLCSFKRRGAVS